VPLDRPIFIVAPPRCGTTLLYECLVSHPDVGFFNRANRLFPDSPRLAHLVTRIAGAVGAFRDTPRESRRLWFHFLRPRDTDVADERDARPEVRAWYERRIAAVLALRGATRYASKLPAHSAQVPFLLGLFPDAVFLRPVRDWRAAVASTMVKGDRDYGGGWFGVRMPGWKEAARRPAHLRAAWQFREVNERLDEQESRHGGRFHRVAYEDLVATPPATMGRTFEACGLRSDDGLLARLPKDIRPAHDRWRETLTPERLEEIRRENGEALRRWEIGADA
jgi:hypothetical protein